MNRKEEGNKVKTEVVQETFLKFFLLLVGIVN